MKLSKTQRQHKVAYLLEKEEVQSQAELVQLLAEQGVEATQVTVSRDLEELGALKVRRPGGLLVYALPGDAQMPPSRESQLRRVLSEWVADIASSSNLVVVRTPPGCAHVVASALDRAGLSGVAGTLAGDDTVLVVAAEGVPGATVARALEDLASPREA